MNVKDAMTPNPTTVCRDTPLGVATSVMIDHGIRHLPVLDAGGRLVGMLTDRDVLASTLAPVMVEYLSPPARRRLAPLTDFVHRLRVDSVMTWDVMTIASDAPLAQAAAVMFEACIGCLPVVDGGELVGIVTERDALKALAGTLTSTRGADPDTYLR